MIVARTCRQCAKSFTLHDWEERNGPRQFCSQRCHGLAIRKPIDLTTRGGRQRARDSGLVVPHVKSGKAPQEFWSFVTKTDTCWLWTGRKSTDGYGRAYVAGRHIMAHHQSWRLAGLSPVPLGMVLMHSCDVPNCVNPAHLSIGTHLENVRDCINKGRRRYRTKEGIRTGLAVREMEP